MTEDCNRPKINEIEKFYCVGNEIAVHSVLTEMQCLDNCLRHPNCDKYIFDRQENQNCRLLYTGDIASVPGAVSPTRLDGRCSFKIATVSVLEILGSEFMTVKLGQKTVNSRNIFGMLLFIKGKPISLEKNKQTNKYANSNTPLA